MWVSERDARREPEGELEVDADLEGDVDPDMEGDEELERDRVMLLVPDLVLSRIVPVMVAEVEAQRDGEGEPLVELERDGLGDRVEMERVIDEDGDAVVEPLLGGVPLTRGLRVTDTDALDERDGDVEAVSEGAREGLTDTVTESEKVFDSDAIVGDACDVAEGDKDALRDRDGEDVVERERVGEVDSDAEPLGETMTDCENDAGTVTTVSDGDGDTDGDTDEEPELDCAPTGQTATANRRASATSPPRPGREEAEPRGGRACAEHGGARRPPPTLMLDARVSEERRRRRPPGRSFGSVKRWAHAWCNAAGCRALEEGVISSLPLRTLLSPVASLKSISPARTLEAPLETSVETLPATLVLHELPLHRGCRCLTVRELSACGW